MMRFRSTRDAQLTAGFAEALAQGLAPDGGLYVPTEWPRVQAGAFPVRESLPATGARLLALFAAGDPLAEPLPQISAEAFNFPAPLVALGGTGRLAVLELFHGPTAAFKDFGARFLAASLARLRAPASRPLTILVATSGDTGGAVAAAFHGRPGIEVAVLFPKGLVSPTQERQLTCWGGNVRSFAVRGTFDDCQRLVKQAFLDRRWQEERALSSANSINLGRLLPQAVYYAAASLAVLRCHGEPASFVIPSGNLGNAVACIWARRLGLPIAQVVLAHNANRTVPDFLDTGEWQPRASVPTLASAMDVGNPSNMERLRALYPQLSEIRSAVSACAVEDEAIRARIRQGYQELGQVWCPHTATAAEAYARLPAERRDSGRWVLVSTAHPAKFREIVEPLIGRDVAMPESLAKLFARPSECTEIDADLESLRDALRDGGISEGRSSG
ncbi:MAG TPA: threonine synthase [Steroidobacteraceae bacterium]|nr:threonine synthase [Steroidobacteraceae bacterium]